MKEGSEGETKCSPGFVPLFRIVFGVIQTCPRTIRLELKTPINTGAVSYCLNSAMQICLSWWNS